MRNIALFISVFFTPLFGYCQRYTGVVKGAKKGSLSFVNITDHVDNKIIAGVLTDETG